MFRFLSTENFYMRIATTLARFSQARADFKTGAADCKNCIG